MQRVVLKSISETIATTPQQNDDQLFFPVSAGETWVFSFDLIVSNNNNATPDWQASILGAAGWTCDVTMSGKEPAGAIFPQVRSTNCTNAPTTMQNTAVLASTIPYNINIQGTVTATTAGNVQLRWSPITAGNLTVLAGSQVVAYKLK